MWDPFNDIPRKVQIVDQLSLPNDSYNKYII